MVDSPDFIPDAQMAALAPEPSKPVPHGVILPSDSKAPDFISDEDFLPDDEKYSTTGQMAKTGAEGALRGLVGHTIANAIETKGLGVKPEDIEARETENPITSMVGQGAGMLGGALSGTGEVAAMTKAGELASGLVNAGRALEPMAARIGSNAVQQATEMMVMAGDDELAKKIWTNPDETAEQAIGNIGLAGVLGGAGGAFVTGAVSPLWKATVGPKVDGFLSSLSGKLGGSSLEESGASTAQSLFDRAGIDPAIAPSAVAKINGDPLSEELYSKLSQTDTTHFGKETQKQLANLTNDVGSKMAETVGHDAKYVSNLDSIDKYTRGNEIAETLHKELKSTIEPINKAYDEINTRFKASTISLENQKVMADNIAQKAMDGGWLKAADDNQKNLMKNVLEKLPKQETAEDLKMFITNLRESHPYGSPSYQAARDISNILKEAQERSVMEAIIAKGGSSEAGEQALEQYKALKGEYTQLMNKVDGLNEHLHVGKYYGPGSFLNNLKEMGTTNGEGILNRLSGKTKADTLNALAQFPETLSKVRQYHVDELLNSSKGAEGSINPRKFNSQYDKLSPQLKDLVADKTSQERLKALNEIIEKTNDKTHNWSNTARTVDKLTHGAISPLALIATAMGHGVAGMATHLSGLGLKEGGDAIRYGILKFLGSGQPIKSEAFHSMVQMIQNTIKGESAVNKAVKALFQAGAITAVRASSANDLHKLDNIIAKNQADGGTALTEKMVNSQTGHYLPQHQMALSATTMRAVDYLSKLKPQETKLSPLSRPIPPSKMAEARYNRALEIADNPNIVLSHIKDGTLKVSDIADLQAMYPGVYKGMQTKLMHEVVNHHAEEEPIPYKTRLSLSLFMATPLDATMTPSSIQAAQMSLQAKPQAPQQPQGGGKGKGSTSKLGKSNSSYMTKDQAAEANRNDRS